MALHHHTLPSLTTSGPRTAHRPKTAMACPQNHSPRKPTALERKPQVLARRHRSHSQQTVRPSHETETRARRTAAREGHVTQGTRSRLATQVLHRSARGQRQTGTDGRWASCVKGAASKRLSTGRRRCDGCVKYAQYAQLTEMYIYTPLFLSIYLASNA